MIGGGGGSVCDRTTTTAGDTSLIVQYCTKIIVGISNLTLFHQLDVVSYRLTLDGLYMYTTSPFICSILVLLLLSLHSQTLCPVSLKLPSVSVIIPAEITCVIDCFHNQKSLRRGLSLGNQKLDHYSPTHLCFKYFWSRDFPEDPITSDKNNTCWCTQTLLSRQRLSM